MYIVLCNKAFRICHSQISSSKNAVCYKLRPEPTVRMRILAPDLRLLPAEDSGLSVRSTLTPHRSNPNENQRSIRQTRTRSGLSPGGPTTRIQRIFFG